MTTNQTFAITFIARTDRKDRNNNNIYVRITIDGRRTEFLIVGSIPKESWNPIKERIDSKYKDFRRSNAYIDQVRSKITNSYRELVLREELVSPVILKNLFFGKTDDGKTILELFRYHNQSQNKVLRPGTLKNYFTTQKYIVKFLKDIKRVDDMRLTEINYQLVTEFDSYLRNYVPTDHHKPMSNNGVMKHLERFRKVTSMGIRLEWMAKDPFEKFKFSFNKVERGFLTEKELEVLK